MAIGSSDKTDLFQRLSKRKKIFLPRTEDVKDNDLDILNVKGIEQVNISLATNGHMASPSPKSTEK
jgi:hypothetical protein